jgi:hypothetical protein
MHLCNKGFTENYHVWNRHGEHEATDGETHEVGLDDETDGGSNTYGDFDHMDEMVLDAAGPNYDQNMQEPPNAEASSFFHMLEAADKPLWENCEKHTQLSAVTRLLSVKSEHNVSVSCFDGFIKAINEMLPQDANLPGSFYKCKKVVEALGMPVQKIDVCKNDCMLYYKEHSNRRKCITCNEPRYAEGDALPENKKGTPQKVLRYLPIIPRLQRLYMSQSTATHMTYHKEGLESEKRNNEKRKKKLAHPADTEAWKEVDKKYPDFAKEPRNVRLGLSTDGFTPFNHTASSYSCWPVFIVPYNLPPALCMKQQNIFLNMVIPGPKHPGKNIDVFFRPLIDELMQLWTDGVSTYDRSRNQNFLMKAALIGTVSDFPAYGMLSGWSTHGKLACPICMEDTKSFRLEVGGKPCWFDCHRRFLPKRHPFRREKKKFTKDREEKDGPPTYRSSLDVYNWVKSYPQITFGTKVGNQEIEGFKEAHNWVKKSIFWELPYWPSLLIRHNLDVMHIEKNVFDNVWNTVMDIPKRTKDNAKSRFDLANICDRPKLHMERKPTGRWVK